MSAMIKCDCCNRIDYTDSRSDVDYWEIKVNGRDGYSTFHLCEECYKNRFLLKLMGINLED